MQLNTSAPGASRWLAFAASALAVTAAAAAAPVAAAGVPIDPTHFDVAGVRLGMSPAEARGVIAGHFGVPVTAVHPGTLPNGLTRGNYISTMSYEAHGEAIVVSFEPVALTPDGSPKAQRITYELPETDANEAALRAAAVRKYGPPSTVDPVTGSLCWSLNTRQGDCSPREPASLGVEAGPSARPAMIAAQVTLNDTRYLERYMALLQSVQSRPPKF